jgi:hypothetical protein
MGNKSIMQAYFKTEVKTKTPVDILCFWGNSLCNGYSTDWLELSAGDQTAYTPDADVAGIYRWPNNTLDQTVDNSIPILLNRNYNAGTTRQFGNETFCAVDIKTSGLFSSPIHLHCFTYNGTALVDGDAERTWAPSGGSSFYWGEAMADLYHYLRYIKFKGYSPIIRFLNFSLGVLTGFSTDQTAYKNTILEMTADFRLKQYEFGGDNIAMIWGKDYPKAGNDDFPEGAAYRAGTEEVELLDTLFDSFDFYSHTPMANDTVHPRTFTVREFGRFLASKAIFYLNGNNLPVASNVTVSGTLREGQEITAAYTYTDADGDLEGATEINLTFADNASGLNELRISTIFKGQTYTLTSTHRNKYIKVKVTPISLTGALVGKCVESAWTGPVISL